MGVRTINPERVFFMLLLSEKEAPARYAAPQLQPRSDETQTELFGHSEQQLFRS